jgi:hypothetical protein
MLAFSAAGALCGAAGLDRDAALRHRLLIEAADRARRRQRLEPQAMTGT